MKQIPKALKSRTVWTLVVMFVIGGVEGIREAIPPQYLDVVFGVLGLVAGYFKLNPSQKY